MIRRANDLAIDCGCAFVSDLRVLFASFCIVSIYVYNFILVLFEPLLSETRFVCRSPLPPRAPALLLVLAVPISPLLSPLALSLFLIFFSLAFLSLPLCVFYSFGFVQCHRLYRT